MSAGEQSVTTSLESLLRPEQNQVYEAGLASLRYLESESLQHRDTEVPDLKTHTERVEDLRVLTNTLIDDERWLVSGAQLMTRVIQVSENFTGATKTFVTDEVRNMAEGATIVLHRSLELIHDRDLDELAGDGKRAVLDGLAKLLKSYHAYDVDFAYRYLQDIKNNLSDPSLYKAREEIEEFIKSERFESEVAYVYDGELRFNIKGPNQRSDSNELCRDLFGEVLVRHGIDLQEFLPASTANHEVYVSTNFNSILSLDRAEPKSASFLFNNFGIRFFYRYPQEVLAAQYRERKAAGPYVLALTGWYENEGQVFGDTLGNIQELWLNLWQKLNGKIPFRITEADNQKSLFERFIALRDFYGRKPEIPLGICTAHGLRDLMALSSGSADGYIRLTDDFGPPGRYIRSFFSEDATIILASCETGATGGIAQKISKDLRIRVIAPTIPAFLAEIEVFDANGKIDPKPDYREYRKGNELGPKLESGQVLTYERGKLVELVV